MSKVLLRKVSKQSRRHHLCIRNWCTTTDKNVIREETATDSIEGNRAREAAPASSKNAGIAMLALSQRISRSQQNVCGAGGAEFAVQRHSLETVGGRAHGRSCARQRRSSVRECGVECEVRQGTVAPTIVTCRFATRSRRRDAPVSSVEPSSRSQSMICSSFAGVATMRSMLF